jgi:hypothetical protein
MQRVASFLVLLLLADFSSSSGSPDVKLQFQSLMDSGNHKGAYKFAEELTKLRPDDGTSWYVAHVNNAITVTELTALH